MEMAELCKAWKAKSKHPTLSTSPLEISPTAGEIPTFPQPRRSRLGLHPPGKVSLDRKKNTAHGCLPRAPHSRHWPVINAMSWNGGLGGASRNRRTLPSQVLCRATSHLLLETNSDSL